MGRFRRFVAIGDSFTEGLHDDIGDDGRHRGWADQVVAGLAADAGSIEYANLAVRGKLLDEVLSGQLPSALALKPDLVSFHAGANDVLRPGREIAPLAARYGEAVARLRTTSATVVLFTVLERSGAASRAARALSRRIARFNDEVVRSAARAHGAVLVDVGPVTALHDRRLWDEDRLHLSPAGHVRVAAATLETLGVTDEAVLGGPAGWWRTPLDEAGPVGRVQRWQGEVRWVRRHLLPWVGRRVRGVSSGDGMTAKLPTVTEVRGSW